MLKKSLVLALSLLLAVSFSAFAGEGSDTVGGGKLLPQLRYGYSVSGWKTHGIGGLTGLTSPDYSSHSYYAQANWGILENVELVALAGSRSFMTEDSETLSFPPLITLSKRETTEWARSFMWGLGVKGTFWRADNGFYTGGGALFTHTRAAKYSATEYISINIPPLPQK